MREPSGEPSELAKDGFFEHIQPKQGQDYDLWHGQKVGDYLVGQGIKKVGVSSAEASKITEARKLARAYVDTQSLEDEGSKLGYMILSELVDDLKAVGLETFNQALKLIGYKGEEVRLDNW